MSKHVCKLYNLHPTSKRVILNGTTTMFPQQIIMRLCQFHTATYVKEHTSNVWIGFGVMGAFQGVIYGQANVQWARILKISNPSLHAPLRGNLFSIGRDVISQGIPYHATTSYDMVGYTFLSTIASQGLHNFQTLMQVDKNINYRTAISHSLKHHGMSIFWKGFEARLLMILFINSINRLVLNPHWSSTEA